MPAPRPASSPLASKLSPPSVRPGQVPRDAVCQAIVDARAARLVLVRAPAGFGKTTTLVQARDRLADQGLDTAWLTPDRADNDLPRFLAGLQQAVAAIAGELPAGDHPLTLLGALARHDTPFALFLDDFELITAPAVLGLVREIVDHLPRRGQLVLGSRSLPDQGLGLGRLRAADQLLEIDAEQLRFSLAETQRFFALRHAGLQAEMQTELMAHLPELLRKTEGWIAALWPASMALDGVVARQGSVAGFIGQFSGSDRAVADFLAEDVLSRQTPEIRDFLLRTSILRHLNAARILAQLDAANLFITPLGDLPGGAAAGPADAADGGAVGLLADPRALAGAGRAAPVRLHQATARFRLALGTPGGAASGLAGSAGFPPSHGNAWAGVLYAGAMYETHQLALAERLLNVYLPLARDVGLPDPMILSHVMR